MPAANILISIKYYIKFLVKERESAVFVNNFDSWKEKFTLCAVVGRANNKRRRTYFMVVALCQSVNQGAYFVTSF